MFSLRWLGLIASVVPGWGQAATVSANEAPVLERADPDSAVRAKLAKGDAVVVELRVSGGGKFWCGVLRAKPRLTGYVDCAQLTVSGPSPERERGAYSSPQMRAQVDELVELTGMESALRQALHPAGFAQTLRAKGLDAAASKEILEIYARLAKPETFLGPIRSALLEGYSEEWAEDCVRFGRSPVGRRMTALEAAGEAQIARNPEEVQRVLKQGMPPTRAALVERLWKTVDFSNAQFEMAISVLRGLSQALNPRVAPAQRMTEEGLQAVGVKLQEMKPQIVEAGKARLAFLYHQATDGEMQEYVRFLESPAGRWLTAAGLRGAAQGGRIFGSQLGAELGAHFERRKRR